MPQHVLIVDDDTGVRSVMRLVLQEEGYVAHEAVDDAFALGQLRASVVPLVVVMHLRMPQMDGLQLLAMVAADAMLATRHSYILTVTDRGAPAEFTPLLSRLRVPVLEKPFSLDALLEVVARASMRLAISRVVGESRGAMERLPMSS